MYYPTYTLAPPQQPLPYTDEEIRKLRESRDQHFLNVEEYRAKRQIDEEFEGRRIERLAQYRAARAMASVVVCERTDGSFWFAYEAEGVSSEYKEVFPGVRSFKSKFYNSSRIMEVTCLSDGAEKNLRIDYSKEDAVKDFQKKLRSNGIRIATSEKYRIDVLWQVLSMLAKASSEEVLPLHHGWNEEDSGSFYFVGIDVPTLGEVIKNDL